MRTRIIILLLFIATCGHTQTKDCCDSLIKAIKGKTTKTTCRKQSVGQNHDINICIDNSHSANNYATGSSGLKDTLNNPNPCPPTTTVAPKDDNFYWWRDFFKLILQFLIALVPLFILIFKYLTQKEKEFKETITENKRMAYSTFLEDFTETAVKIMHDKNTDTIRDDRARMFARNQLLLYANDEVILAYHTWIEYADKEYKDINKEVELFGKLLVEIRKDIHGDTKVTKDDISNLNPFNRG